MRFLKNLLCKFYVQKKILLFLFFFAFLTNSIDPVVNGDVLELTSQDQFNLSFTIREIVSKNITKIAIKDGIIDDISYAPWFPLIHSIDIQTKAIDKIPDYCFSNSSFLRKVTLASHIKTIGDYAFNCSAIDEINLENVEIFGMYSFSFTIYLHHIDVSSAQSFGEHAFDTSGLIEITIPDRINTLPKSLFEYSMGLTTFTAHNLTSLASYMFQDCNKLTTLDIDFDKIESVGYSGFRRCGLKSFTIGKKLTYLHPDIFAESSIEEMVIPETVVTLESNSFFKCNALKKLTILPKLTGIPGYFCPYCAYLTEVILPDTITSIGMSAFASCYRLEKINIENVQTIEISAFEECFCLSLLHIPKVVFIHRKAFQKCYNVSFSGFEGRENEITIMENAFNGCEKLNFNILSMMMTGSSYQYCRSFKTLRITFNQTHPNKMFLGCSNLEEVVFTEQSTATKLNEWMFTGCTKLKSVVLCSSITSIGEYAFYSTNLETLDLKNVNSIDFRAFTRSKLSKLIIHKDFAPNEQFVDCYNLNTVVLGENVKDFTLQAFANCNITNFEIHGNNYVFDDNVLYDSTKTVLVCAAGKEELFTVPQQITKICFGAFSNYAKIKKIVLYQWISFICGEFANVHNLKTFVFNSKTDFVVSDYMFYNCTSLETIHLSSDILTIGKFAFHFCAKLPKLENTHKATFIGESAFLNCISLKEINISGALIIKEYAFFKCKSLEKIEFSENFLFAGDESFSMSGVKEVTLKSKNRFSFQDMVFKDCPNLKKVYYLAQGEYRGKSLGGLFIGTNLEYVFIGKDVNPGGEFFVFMWANLKIEVDPENKRFEMRGNCLYDKLENKANMFVSSAKETVQLESGVVDYKYSYLLTNMDYHDGNYLVFTERGPSTLKIPADTKYMDDLSNEIFIYTICYDGDYMMDGGYYHPLRKVITNGNYPYPYAFQIPVEVGECEPWSPVPAANSVSNNVFGLTKKETFLIIAIAIVSAMFVAFVIYFAIKWRGQCLKKKSSPVQQRRDSQYVDEIELPA